MSQTSALVEALKQVLKSRGVTYAELARLRMSEASVQRVFSRRNPMPVRSSLPNPSLDGGSRTRCRVVERRGSGRALDVMR
jgi:hypothetical protein